MGEVLRNFKPKLIILLGIVLLCLVDAHASFREAELFDRGYDCYLSYRPREAVETFTAFLKEFPYSSVKDAAMYWLGMSFTQLGEVEEARKVFSGLEKQFPSSPFVEYAAKELEVLEKKPDKADLLAPGVEGRKDLEAGIPRPTRKTDAEEPSKSLSDGEHESTAEQDDVVIKATEPQEANRGQPKVDKVSPVGELIETKEPGNDIREPVGEAGGAENGIPDVAAMGGETSRSDSAEKRDAAPQKRKSVEKRSYERNSAYVLARLDIKEVPWRSGDAAKDGEDEARLYSEAMRRKIGVDPVKYEELVERYEFSPAQADYLRKYLVICELLSRKLGELPEEKMVECLIVKYGDEDKYRKIVISPDLQRLARRGVAFEEIQKTYRGLVVASVVKFERLDAATKDNIRNLRDGEIGVVWSLEGYTIFKPVVRRLSYLPFFEAGPEIRNEIKTFVREWLKALREKGREPLRLSRE